MCSETKARIMPSAVHRANDSRPPPSNPPPDDAKSFANEQQPDEGGVMEAAALVGRVARVDDVEQGPFPLSHMRRKANHVTYAATSAVCLLSALLVYFAHRQSLTPRAHWVGSKFRRRPIAIIHIGPRKTASTAIQYALRQNATRVYLKKDNFLYLGKTRQQYWGGQIHAYMVNCVQDERTLSEECTKDSRWTNFAAKLDGLKKRNTNVILSDEGLIRFLSQNPIAMNMFSDAFAGFDIRVVAVYRRYYEWILSEYSQEVKPRKEMKMSKKLERLIGFPQWYSNQTQTSSNETKRSSWYFPLDKASLQPWISQFGNVEIFNMHEDEGTNLIERFICSLREIPSACEAARSGLLPISTEMNSAPPQSLFEAQLVALYIQREKIVPRFVPLDDVVKEIEKLLARTNVKIPRRCLGYADLSDIEIKTLTDEEALLPAFAHADGVIDLARQGFRQAVAKNKYCGIKFDLVEKQWKAFFVRLRKDFVRQRNTTEG